jgi:hypothetical protein
MSDFIEVGTISRKTLLRNITFGCAGKIDRRRLKEFAEAVRALAAEYGLTCVATSGGGKGGGYGARAAGGTRASKTTRTRGSRARKTP